MKLRLTIFLVLICCWPYQTPAQDILQLKFKLNTDGTLVSLAVSPDSRLVAASYGMDTTARVWETSTGRLRRTLTGRITMSEVPNLEGRSHVSFSPDGKSLMVIAREAGEVRLWEIETGKQYLTLSNLLTVAGGAFSPDGKLLAVAAGLHRLQLLDLATRKIVKTEWQSNDLYNAWTVNFTEDGSTLLSWMTGRDDNVGYCAFDVSTGKLKTTLRIPRGKKTRWIRSSDGLMMVNADDQNVLTLWDMLTGSTVQTIRGIEGQILGVTVSPDRRSLAVLNGKVLNLYDIGSGALESAISGLDSAVSLAAFSPDNKLIVTNDKQGLKVWDRTTRELKQTLREARWPVRFSLDGTLVLTGSKDRNVLLWQIMR